MKFIRLITLAILVHCLSCPPAVACRYNVRDIGFADLGYESYYLYGYVRQNTPADTTSIFKKTSHAALTESNIKFEIINIDQQQNHPAMKYLHAEKVESFPAAVLVSPYGRTIPVPVAKSGQPFEQSLSAALDNIASSPKREEMLQQASEVLGFILLIEGPEQEKNKKLRDIASNAIEKISMQMKLMPKLVKEPPALIKIDSKSLPKERILLWSIGAEVDKISQPCAAILYGKGRLIGPLLKDEQITETTLVNILSIVGADCECGLDRSWILGKSLPVRWDKKIQAQVAKSLGFEPENPMVKMEMSQILRQSPTSDRKPQDLDNLPNISLGYKEFVIELEPNEPGRQTQPVQVQKIAPETDVKNASKSAPVAEMYRPLRTTIFVLAILFVVVVIVGVVVLVRAKTIKS
ncbi:MAG: hypothetical protein ACYS18_10740 [Planctomycetota bacterium]|jgi:hypothetical protein